MGDRVALGVDAGASLVKLALRVDGVTSHELLPAAEIASVLERVGRLDPRSLGLTVAGAGELARQLAI